MMAHIQGHTSARSHMSPEKHKSAVADFCLSSMSRHVCCYDELINSDLPCMTLYLIMRTA